MRRATSSQPVLAAVACLGWGALALNLITIPWMDSAASDVTLTVTSMFALGGTFVWAADAAHRILRRDIETDRTEMMTAIGAEAAKNRQQLCDSHHDLLEQIEVSNEALRRAVSTEMAGLVTALTAALDENGKARYAQAVGDTLTYVDTLQFPALTDDQVSAAENVREFRPKSSRR
jgi:hypothetical protein